MVVPKVIIRFLMGFSMNHTIQPFWGTPMAVEHPISFHYTGWFIGIPPLDYCNPQLEYWVPYDPATNHQATGVLMGCSMKYTIYFWGVPPMQTPQIYSYRIVHPHQQKNPYTPNISW